MSWNQSDQFKYAKFLLSIIFFCTLQSVNFAQNSDSLLKEFEQKLAQASGSARVAISVGMTSDEKLMRGFIPASWFKMPDRSSMPENQYWPSARIRQDKVPQPTLVSLSIPNCPSKLPLRLNPSRPGPLLLKN